MNTLIRNIVISVVLAVSTAYAGEMIVTKKGQSVRARSTTTIGDILQYIDEKTGDEHSMPAGDVDAVLPIPEKGKNYTRQQIESFVEKIEEVKPRHISMVKKLNILQNEWEVFLNIDPNISKKIDLCVKKFMAYKHSKSAYDKAIMELHMLKFKDKTAANTAAIESALSKVKTEYIGVDIDKFVEMANSPGVTVDELKELYKQGEKIEQRGSKAERKLAIDSLVKARTTILDTFVPYARRAFGASGSLTAYVRGRSVLDRMYKDVAVTYSEKKRVEKELKDFVALVSGKYSKFDFSYKDYPLSPRDKQYLEVTEEFSSKTMSQYLKVKDEWAYLIPVVEPQRTDMKGSLVMPFMAVFRRTPSHKVQYAVMITAARNKKLFKHYIPFPMKISNARAPVRFKYDLSKLGSDVIPFKDEGNGHIMLYLAMRKASLQDKVADDKGWERISLACKIPFPVDEPEADPEL